jgi:hypothetical protein
MSFNITRNATKHKKLVIGTSTTVPADGDLHVDGNVGIGSQTPNVSGYNSDHRVLTIDGQSGTDGYGTIELKRGGSTSGAANLGEISFVNGTDVLAAIRGRSEDADSGQLNFLTQDDGGVETTRLTIDSAGLATFAPGTNTAGINVTTAGDPAYGVKIDSAGAGITNPSLWVYNNGASSGPLAFIEQDHTSGTGDVLKIQNDGSGRSIYVEGGGIVEANGVLRSNLLSNSGFDVWSNSTLENVATIKEDDCASDDTGDWTETRTALAFDTDHYTYTPSGGYNEAYLTGASFTAGKLYKISIDVANGTGSTSTLQLKLYDGSAILSPTFSTTPGPSFVTHTFVAEIVTTISGSVVITDSTHFSGNIQFKNFIVTEVTPGILTAGLALGPDGWKKRYAGGGSANIYREHDGSNTKDGSFYSLKYVSTDTVAYAHALQWPVDSSDPVHLAKFAGRTVTFGCWIKQISTTGSVKIGFEDNSTDYQSSANTATDAWEWMEFTRTLTSTTVFGVKIYVTATGKTVYISQPILSLGSAIGSGNYSRPSGEIVDLEKSVTVGVNAALAAADDKILNLEALTDGKIPKGAKAVNLNIVTKNTSVTDYQGVSYGPTSGWDRAGSLQCLPLVNSLYQTASGVVNCDSNGDIYQEVSEAGSTINYNGIAVTQVHLR